MFSPLSLNSFPWLYAIIAVDGARLNLFLVGGRLEGSQFSDFSQHQLWCHTLRHCLSHRGWILCYLLCLRIAFIWYWWDTHWKYLVCLWCRHLFCVHVCTWEVQRSNFETAPLTLGPSCLHLYPLPYCWDHKDVLPCWDLNSRTSCLYNVMVRCNSQLNIA